MRQRRAALDSMPLFGAGRVEAPLKRLGHAWQKAVGLAAEALATSAEMIVEEAGLVLVGQSSRTAACEPLHLRCQERGLHRQEEGKDYGSRGPPVCRGGLPNMRRRSHDDWCGNARTRRVSCGRRRGGRSAHGGPRRRGHPRLALVPDRGWTATLALATVVAACGPALSLMPIDTLRVIVGTLLLIFGLQWLRKAILRAGGYIALRDEDALYQAERAAARAAGAPRPAGIDW